MQPEPSNAEPSLEVGAILGDADPDSMAWSRAIGALSLAVKEQQEGLASAIRLSVIVHVDGRLAPNDFVGVRSGRLDSRRNRLVVQAALAKDGVDDRDTVLRNLLDDAVAEAERFVRKRAIAEGLPEIRRVVEQLPRPSSA